MTRTTTTSASPDAGTDPKRTPVFPPLDTLTRPAVSTAQAAYYLNRQPQTLRAWACGQRGEIRPLRINGRLAWRVADLLRVLGGAQ